MKRDADAWLPVNTVASVLIKTLLVVAVLQVARCSTQAVAASHPLIFSDDFEFGDVVFYNVSYQHRLWPRELPEEGVPSFFYGVIELNGTSAGKNRVGGRPDGDSGGHTVFLSPGVQWVSLRWVVEAAVQLPIVQDLNGDALEVDYAATLGVRFRF